MASLRTKRNDKPSDAVQSKRSGAYMETSSEDFPSSLSRRARKAAESARKASQDASRPRATSTLPQTLPRPAPSQTYAWKQNLTFHSQVGNSNSSNGSVGASTSPFSSSAASSRTPDSSKQARNVLRRKQPTMTQGSTSKQYHTRQSSMRTGASSSVPQAQASLGIPKDSQVDRGLTESPAEIHAAQEIALPTVSTQPVTIYPELDRYRDYKPQTTATNHYFEVPYPISTDLPPPTPLFSGASDQHSAFSGSPSTRYSESPGPGPYSRDTTPTSMSSQSPGLVAPVRIPVPRPRQVSPADVRPPVTRRRTGSASNDVRSGSSDSEGLAAVRESSTSYSSNSTLRATAVRDQQKKNGMPYSGPHPPSRGASEKLGKSRVVDEALSKPGRDITKNTTAVPSCTRTASKARTACETPKSTTPRAIAPTRPSREGAGDLNSRLGLPLPVVHSNLSATSLSERRQSVQNMPNAASRSVTSSHIDQKQPSFAPRIGREPTPVPQATVPVPEPQTKHGSRGALRTPSPSITSTLKTRFPLFGRRNKTAPGAPTAAAEKPDRQPRKGPAAGTGHEGYGRLGHVRRRSANLTGALRAIPGTMSSQESLASNQSQDPFLAQRMSPVIIAGGEVIENQNYSSEFSTTESNQNMAMPRPSLGSKSNSEVSLAFEGGRNTLWPSALPRGAAFTPAVGHRRQPSDSSDSDGPAMRSTLAYRRSAQRLRVADQANIRLPKPITVRAGTATPAINSQDTTLLSDGSTFSSRPTQLAVRGDFQHPVPKKLTKRPKSPRKWNIFSRSTSQSASKKKQSEAPPVSATVQAVQPKPVAFYTMIDPAEQQEDRFQDVEDVLRQAQSSRISSPISQGPTRTERGASVPRNQSQEAQDMSHKTEKPGRVQAPKNVPIMTSSQDTRRPSTEASRSLQPPPSLRTTRTRPSRLPQVGRIPKVSTTQIDEPLPSPMSFSRPFNRASLQMQPRNDNSASANQIIAEGAKPTEPPSPVREPSQEIIDNTIQRERDFFPSMPAPAELASGSSRTQNEFLAFSPGKGSVGTSTTGSSSSGIHTYSDATAVIPEPDAPLVEDEVWDEYNDFLEENGTRGHCSTTSSLGKPFHLEVWGRRLAKEIAPPLESPTINPNPETETHSSIDARVDSVESECETEFEFEAQVEPETEVGPQVKPAPTSSSVYSSDMTAKINEVLEAAGGSTPPVGEFVSGHGSRNNTTEPAPPPQNQRLSTASSQTARFVRESLTSSSSQGSDSTSATSQVELRVGSMTVSKWLTFDHVLFSPVRDELVPVVGSLKRHSILVIDGLGNDDWSFYAAETYPAATFFNLSPRAPLSDQGQSSTSSISLTPPNHHQIQYKSHADKFPFGPQSFTCVVYRFPTAAPESHYRNIINEARRVLKPGGYMELSILDVDLNNMGNNARRAVRRLKERIHIRAPEISLASSSDLILRLLGRKGFMDIKTCRVGVPLANAVTSSGGGTAPSSSTKTSTRRSGADRSRGNRHTRNLSEAMSGEGPEGDENITKMVSKVGRWWYDRCYQSVALESGGRSMWADQALVAECEEWRTSLKLMVCHARIPDGRNRLASI